MSKVSGADQNNYLKRKCACVCKKSKLWLRFGVCCTLPSPTPPPPTSPSGFKLIATFPWIHIVFLHKIYTSSTNWNSPPPRSRTCIRPCKVQGTPVFPCFLTVWRPETFEKHIIDINNLSTLKELLNVYSTDTHSIILYNCDIFI